MRKRRAGKRRFYSKSREYRRCSKYLALVDNLMHFSGMPESLLIYTQELDPNYIVPWSEDKPISTWKSIRQAALVLRDRILRNKKTAKYRAYAYEDSVPYMSMLHLFVHKCFPLSVQTARSLTAQMKPYAVYRDKDTVYLYDISSNTTIIETAGCQQQIRKEGIPYVRIDISYHTFASNLPSDALKEDGNTYLESVESIFLEKEDEEQDSYCLRVAITKELVLEDVQDGGFVVLPEKDENCYDSHFSLTGSGQQVTCHLHNILTASSAANVLLYLKKESQNRAEE